MIITAHKNLTLALSLACLFFITSTGCGSSAEQNDTPVTIFEETDNALTSEATSSTDALSSGNASSIAGASTDIAADEPLVIPYGTLEEAGIHQECIDLIEKIITSDIEQGFTSAQLSIIRSGKLVYENAFGKVNSYNPDGTRKTDSPDVTKDTLYDLASVSKMIGVNYALQKLVTDGEISIDEKITDFLGQEFVDNTIFIDYEEGSHESLDTIKQWKNELTIAHLLRHQGGFPPSPKYHNPTINPETFEYDPEIINPLFSSTSADSSAKKATIEAICKTPLMFEPGSKVMYSDVDYMLLGLIVESKTGKDLNTYLQDTFCRPMGLTHVTYNPLENGFSRDDCAATELNGNTRDGYISFDGIRTDTVQGQVHDEMAYYCMGGISGHAGVFANATDLAMLGTLMLDGTYGDTQFFSPEVINQFTAPKSDDHKNWGLGWWRQGDMQRTNYFGTKSSTATFGHLGWTGTLLMIDPEKELVIAYLTNKINSPVTDIEENPNKFNGNWYTAATLGFVPEILYTGLDSNEDVHDSLTEYLENLVNSSDEAVKNTMPQDHPARLNALSKHKILDEYTGNN